MKHAKVTCLVFNILCITVSTKISVIIKSFDIDAFARLFYLFLVLIDKIRESSNINFTFSNFTVC